MANQKTTTISVVIPAFNEEERLGLCLEAITQQTYKPYEVIVVNNNSTDQTAQIAKRFGVKIVKETTQGMIPARDRGFKEARGEIVARTDADASPDPNWLKEIAGAFMDKSVVAATGSLYIHDIPAWLGKTMQPLVIFFLYLNRALFGHALLTGSNMAIRKSALSVISPHTDEKVVHEDFDISCHLIGVGRIVFNPKIRVGYSARRMIHDPYSFFFEYGKRIFTTYFLHHKYLFGPHKEGINGK